MLLLSTKKLINSIDAAMVSELGACRTMFLKAAGIIIEYSTDGGTTWTDYGATDAQKVNLFSTGSTGFIIGKATAATASVNNMLRVTMLTGPGGLYTTLNKFVIFVTTSGSQGCYCTIRCRTQQNYEDNVDTWLTRADHVGISGWSGYNVINIAATATYGNTKSTQYGQWQFIFGCTGHSSSSYAGLSVSKIFGFGGVGWTCPSTMAKTGHLYSFDSSQNATFPAKVTASAIVKSGGTSSQFLKADGSVDSNTYLPLTGGTVTGPIEISTGTLNNNYNEGLRITKANNNWAGITFGSTGLSGAPSGGWFAALNPSGQFIISPDSSSNTTGLTLNKAGDLKWRDNKVWHAGNDGSGSGLDADTLDGNHASAFATSDHTHTTITNSELDTICVL